MRQSLLFKHPKLTHGGRSTKGRRKHSRPFTPKLPLHLVLRSSRARGDFSFRSGRLHGKIDALVRTTANKHHVAIHKYANVGNHLHLLIECKDKRQYRAFVRLLSGQLAMLVTRAKKGSAFARGFFDHIPFSRIVSRGRDFQAVVDYIIRNALEGAGLLKRTKGAKDPELVTIRSYIPRDSYSPELQAELGFS